VVPVHTPFSSLVSGIPRPRLTRTLWAFGATTRNVACRSKSTCGYCWPGALVVAGLESAPGRVVCADDDNWLVSASTHTKPSVMVVFMAV
jgi:hypothetical protein